MEDYKKKYEEKLSKAKTLHNLATETSHDDIRMVLEELFDELKESEDERVRKELKSFFDSEMSDYGNVEWRKGIRYGEIVAWLEKQGKQKSTDKVEPKFKVGDTIVEKDPDECGYETIKDIKNGQYIFTDGYCMNIDEQEGWQLVKTPTIIEQKPAWSEEDENLYNRCMSAIQTRYNDGLFTTNEYRQTSLWLKSLKERYTWKPSDEQIEVLYKYAEQNNHDGSVLTSLYRDLKKLM